MIHRRKLLLKGSAFAAWAPAIVRASSLLPALVATDTCGWAQGGGDIYPTGPSLILKPGREFAANSWVHTRLAANAPIDPMSATWVKDFARMMMANQNGVAALWQGSPPLYIVGPSQPTSRVVAAGDPTLPQTVYLQSRIDAVPIPHPNTLVVEQPWDQEVIIYQPATDTLWEFWLMVKTGKKTTDSAGNKVDEWQATWGGQMNNVSKNPGWWITERVGGFKPGMVAAGIPMLAFYITIDDMLRGEIRHPVGITLGIPDAHGPLYNSPPAQRTDGTNPDPGKIPMGAIFSLPADLNLESYPLLATNGGPKNTWRMIAEAMQNYGMVTFDTGGTSIMFSQNTQTPSFQGRDPYAGPLNGIYRPYCRFTEFPWDKMRILKTNLVSG